MIAFCTHFTPVLPSSRCECCINRQYSVGLLVVRALLLNTNSTIVPTHTTHNGNMHARSSGPADPAHTRSPVQTVLPERVKLFQTITPRAAVSVCSANRATLQQHSRYLACIVAVHHKIAVASLGTVKEFHPVVRFFFWPTPVLLRYRTSSGSFSSETPQRQVLTFLQQGETWSTLCRLCVYEIVALCHCVPICVDLYISDMMVLPAFTQFVLWWTWSRAFCV